MGNWQEREKKNRKHWIEDKRKDSSKKKEFVDREGNRFAVTAQGMFYCPKATGVKKHPCPDCYFCQWCSDSRCGLCRRVPESCPSGKESSD